MNLDRNEMQTTLTGFIVDDLVNSSDVATIGPDEDLLEDSIVDSLGIMRLISFIEQKYEFSVPSEDVVIENFLTINTIVDYLMPRLNHNAH